MHTLILDATYIHRNFLCALVAIDERDRIFWRFAKYESFAAWAKFLSEFSEPKVLVMDGQKGLFAAARTLWPHVRIQRCQFHVISFCIQYLGRHPKEEVGQVILHLLYTLKEVKTPDRRDEWIKAYKGWETRYERFFNARNRFGAFEYPRLRSVRFIIRKALPNLFTYIDIPETPNTTNLVEGWVNSAIAEALRRHRGLHEYEKKTLASIVMSHLKRGDHSNRFL
ncbi:MAG TPA: transposase [Candidatus Paceibacterota bacterium]|nr:transposase [Candidatus Paceibacterota bacterium]